MSVGLLSTREISTVLQGLRDQGAEVSLIAGLRYKVKRGAHATSISLNAGNTRTLLNVKAKLKSIGLAWPLDHADTTKKVAKTTPPDDLERAAIVARARALAAEERIASVAPTGGIMTKPTTKSDEILQEWVKISPHLAEQFLAHNVSNRSLRPDHIRAMARDMEAGKWRKTGEAIKFDTNDRLIDGQHRLNAIIQSGTTVEMLMIVGLDPDVRTVIDTGAGRRASDALHFEDVKVRNASAISAIARLAILRDQGKFQYAFDASNNKVTNAEIVEWFRENQDVVQAIEVSLRVTRALGAPMSVWGYAMLNLLRIDEDKAREFATNVADYRTTGEGDPIIPLINRFVRSSRERERMKQGESLFYIYRSWNAWRTGEELLRLNATGAGRVGGAPVPEPI